jgi:DnaD/phage-associated family protein
MNNKFQGFPPRPEVTPLPNIFFSEVSPLISSMAEYKVVMQVFYLLSRRKGYPRFVTCIELLNDPVIIRGLAQTEGRFEDVLKQSLDVAVNDGILLHVPVESGGKADEAYFINNRSERETIEKILAGTLTIPEATIRKSAAPAAVQQSDIYSLYEQNIGMLTPIIAEELQEAEQHYPAEWIQDAFREAVRANVRNWKYISSILKRWEREGKKDGKYVGDSKKQRDPDKYLHQKYGHMVQR